jgi:hypothetical protein
MVSRPLLNQMPNKTGLLADYAIAALDSVIDTMDLTNENYLEYSMIRHTDQPFGPNVLLAILRSVMTNGTSAQMNIQLKGAALGTLCKFLPTFCSRTRSGSTGGHSGVASLTTTTASSACQQQSIHLPSRVTVVSAPVNHAPIPIPAKSTASAPHGTAATRGLPVPAWVQTLGTTSSPDATGYSTASTPCATAMACFRQLKSVSSRWANVMYHVLGSLAPGSLPPAWTPGDATSTPDPVLSPAAGTDQPALPLSESTTPEPPLSSLLPIPTRLLLLRHISQVVPPDVQPLPRVTSRELAARTEPSPPQADPAPSRDPPWDAFQQDRFRYRMQSPEAITMACLATAKPYVHGVTWSEFTVNVQDLELHPETGTVSPWYCECFDNGVVLNHPISLDVSTMDMDVFLAGFTCQGFDNKRQKEFENFFPKYDKAQHLYDYYETVLRHCQGYNIFVPPLHTLVQAHDLGFWYEHLPAHIQSECIGYIPLLLACCLSNPKRSLVTDPRFEHIRNPDRYTMLANACCAAGHPRLAQNTFVTLVNNKPRRIS